MVKPFKPTKNEQGVYETKALSETQFLKVHAKIAKEQNENRRKAKRTLTPHALNRRSTQDLVRLGKKANGEQFTAADLKRFDQLNKKYKKRRGNRVGINYRELIARSRAIDIKRANNQVTDGSGIVSARPSQIKNGNIMLFRVVASSRSKHDEHRVKFRLENWHDCMRAAGATKEGYKKAVKAACAGEVSFDCSCGRHQYWYRYIATLGNYQLSPPKEMAFPKIRNPELTGVSCKHVIKVFTMLQSPTWQAKLAHQMEIQAKAVGFNDDYRATATYTDSDRELLKRNRKLTVNQEKARAEYQKYLKRTSALAKKLREKPEENKKLREQLLRARKATSKATDENRVLKAENERLARQAKDALKVNLNSFIDGAVLMGASRTKAIEAFSKQKNVPVATLNKILNE
ncbi:MAG: hypothetical protein ACRDCT_15135 [Shewanella sp.]|uniref:hypothetical protein n=1 Tax=Shewanella sp. TaxID=50422 RepID=UPI003F357332